jgi:branched-chain amino acid transport system substrate-binding protein
MRVASTMAVDHANATGGVHGRPITLITIDDACDPQTSVLAANSLVQEHIAVSVGGYCSSATLPTLPIFRQAGIPMILPASNSDDLLKPGYDSVFLLSGTGSQEAAAALHWMGRLGVSRVAIVHDGTSYSANIATVAAERLRSASTLPIADRPPTTLQLAALLELTQGALHHTRATARVIASKADVVYYTGYTAEAGRLTRDLRSAGYRGAVMVADGAVDPAMLTFAEGQADGVYATMVPLAQNLALPATWTQEYQRRANTNPGPFTVQAYDAVTLAVDALRRADPSDGRSIARAIADTHALPLLSGQADFATDGTLAGFKFNLLQVRSGQFTLVDTNAQAQGRIASGY